VPEEPRELSWPEIGEQFDNLLTAASNLLERSAPARLTSVDGAQLLALSHLRIAVNTYKTIRLIVAQKPYYQPRKPEYALAAPVLSRSLVDGLCNLIFLFNDLEVNTSIYWKSAWRNAREEHDRCQKEYSGKPEWSEWLTDKEDLVERMKTEYGISPKEEAKLSLIPYWPIPGKMLNPPPPLRTIAKPLDADRSGHISYLQDWFYRILSSLSHMSGPGLMIHAAPLVVDDWEDLEAVLSKKASDCYFTTITLILSIVSELEAELKLGLAERALCLWAIIADYWGEAEELYSRRYKTLLEPAAFYEGESVKPSSSSEAGGE